MSSKTTCDVPGCRKSTSLDFIRVRDENSNFMSSTSFDLCPSHMSAVLEFLKMKRQ